MGASKTTIQDAIEKKPKRPGIHHIYKIRAWSNKRIKRGIRRGDIEHSYWYERVVVNNLEHAKRLYEEQRSIVSNEHSYAGIESVKAELFEPHIFDDGELAYWPDNDVYIERYNPDNL